MTMTGDVTNTGSNSIKDKLGVFWSKLEKDSLDDMVAMTVNGGT